MATTNIQIYEEYYRVSTINQRAIVIDAEDMINDSRNIAEKFCAIIGLDPKHVQYSWAKAIDECESSRAKMFSTLRNSTGIIRGDKVSISQVRLRQSRAVNTDDL